MVDDKDNDRLECALKWCREHKLKSDRLKLFDWEQKKRQSEKGRRKFLTKKAK